MGFEKPTPIQEAAIPAILKGQDLIACAQTGTGKTAAFLLPILDKLTESPSDGLHTIVLVPTRELAIQIDQQLEALGYFTQTSSLPIYGGRDGASFEQEKKALSLGANIIVATPGRFIAHLNLGYVRLDSLQCLVLDEADRMLDMGFMPDILKIIGFLPKERQTLMFSATMPPKIRQFAKSILRDPEQINFAVSKPAEGVHQSIYHVEDNQKFALLKHVLNDYRGTQERLLIFSATKAAVKEIAGYLKRQGFPAEEIHSDLSQEEREEVLRRFKNGSLPMLVATDILSRGIDVQDIQLVLNYDVPSDAEDYIHRIGRTARAKKEGVAITFVSRKERRKFQNIERLMERRIEPSPLPQDIPA
ncbi:MAG: DEAD/DEAH box helicase, partial [Bacteroidetes bacterium]